MAGEGGGVDFSRKSMRATRAVSFNVKLDGLSDSFRACPEFPLVVVSSSLALTVVCTQKKSRLRQCDAKLFCTAGKICP